MEETSFNLKDVLVVMGFMAFVMLGIFTFAGYIVWAHEQTAQYCIAQNFDWQNSNCITTKSR